MGWTMLKPNKEYYELYAKMGLRFLRKDPLIMWHHKYWPQFDGFICYLLPPIIATHFWGESFICGLLVPGVLRQVLVLHATYLSNSVAHYWDDGVFDPRPYDPLAEARESFFVTLAL